jgi:hypothetical protein
VIVTVYDNKEQQKPVLMSTTTTTTNNNNNNNNNNSNNHHNEHNETRVLSKAVLVMIMDFEPTSDPETFVWTTDKDYSCHITSFGEPIFGGPDYVFAHPGSIQEPMLLALEFELAFYVARIKKDPEAVASAEEHLGRAIYEWTTNERRKRYEDEKLEAGKKRAKKAKDTCGYDADDEMFEYPVMMETTRRKQ